MSNPRLLSRFLGPGYFPKELPPPFTSLQLAIQAKPLLSEWKGDGRDGPRTRAEVYSIPRFLRNRRKISIPNPVSHFCIAKFISDSWGEISKHLGTSSISLFRSTPSIRASRVFDPIDFEEIEAYKNSILSRCDCALMLDISRFYPTIYTHSIAWALHGKEWVKQNVHSKLLKGSIGQALDDLVRRGQDGQSLGIPLGPDTSIVVAEIIGSAVDRELQSALTVNEEIAFRYTDDFFIGLRDGRSVETTLAAVASALSLFELEISSDKTRVVHAATGADPDWALEICQFRLPTERIRQRRALEYYFKKAFHLAQTNPSQNVLGYCISRSRTFDIDAENWSTYEEFILQSARANSMTIETVVRILIDGLRSGRTLNLTWISH